VELVGEVAFPVAPVVGLCGDVVGRSAGGGLGRASCGADTEADAGGGTDAALRGAVGMENARGWRGEAAGETADGTAPAAGAAEGWTRPSF
jgi:hypothetical protein